MRLLFLFLITIINSTFSYNLQMKMYEKNPSVNYLKYLNTFTKPPIYNKYNPIRKTSFDDVFVNICDHNIKEFILDPKMTKMIVKYHNGVCKIFYNDKNINLLDIIKVHMVVCDDITIKIIDDSYHYEK